MRVEASTDVTNLPEQHALEKAGFTREGILRKAQWRGGSWHDLMVYSKLRGEE
jgi:aminoglycoside 6'-N-acetyltransferase